MCALIPNFFPTTMAIPLRVVPHNGPVNRDHYIVTLRSDLAISKFLSKYPRVVVVHRLGSGDNGGTHGVAVKLTATQLAEFQKDPDVTEIEQEGLASPHGVGAESFDATWGVARLLGPLNRTMPEPERAKHAITRNLRGGENTDIYVLDSGIRRDHSEFKPRAIYGANFSGVPSHADTDGHGTAIAAAAAGETYGVANHANIVSVKVWGGRSTIRFSNIIAGLQWVKDKVKATGRPSVVLLAVGGYHSPALNRNIDSVVRSGTPVVVSSTTLLKRPDEPANSPASARLPVVVGSTDITDHITKESNYGPRVDLFAPGQNIPTAGIADDNAALTCTGTSMAAAAVAGIIALIQGPPTNAGAIRSTDILLRWVVEGVLSGMPEHWKEYTQNRLAHIVPENDKGDDMADPGVRPDPGYYFLRNCGMGRYLDLEFTDNGLSFLYIRNDDQRPSRPIYLDVEPVDHKAEPVNHQIRIRRHDRAQGLGAPQSFNLSGKTGLLNTPMILNTTTSNSSEILWTVEAEDDPESRGTHRYRLLWETSLPTAATVLSGEPDPLWATIPVASAKKIRQQMVSLGALQDDNVNQKWKLERSSDAGTDSNSEVYDSENSNPESEFAQEGSLDGWVLPLAEHSSGSQTFGFISVDSSITIRVSEDFGENTAPVKRGILVPTPQGHGLAWTVIPELDFPTRSAFKVKTYNLSSGAMNLLYERDGKSSSLEFRCRMVRKDPTGYHIVDENQALLRVDDGFVRSTGSGNLAIFHFEGVFRMVTTGSGMYRPKAIRFWRATADWAASSTPVGSGPNLVHIRSVATLPGAYFITTDTTSSPPRVIRDSGGTTWRSLGMATLNEVDKSQMWQFVPVRES
ncbi:hypothetical protein B0H13DRAFT_2399832 [Mycena leptocephala]|nr:hypothetical protein B0H13DRAFT_2399832 [Mycena leptocephala]